MQTSISTACPSGTRSDPQRSAVEAGSMHAESFENGTLSCDRVPEELLEGIAAMLARASVAAKVASAPRALRC